MSHDPLIKNMHNARYTPMDGFLILLVMPLALLVLDVAAVAFGAESRESFVDERFRPSFDAR